MGYKETVMSDMGNLPIWTPASNATSFRIVAQAQAKLTWEARQKEVDEAEQRGVQKVVDWIEANKSYHSDFMTPSEFYFRIDEEEWQAFLKEVEK